jgi:hypothetical protein
MLGSAAVESVPPGIETNSMIISYGTVIVQLSKLLLSNAGVKIVSFPLK